MVGTALIRRAIALAAVCIGCASTSMTSMPSPELRGRSFHTILVVGDFADLGLRADTERRFVAASQRGHTKFVASTSVLFPGREYSQAEMASILRENSIDGSLVISPTESGTKTGSVAPTSTSRCTAWTSGGGCQKVTTTTSGGGDYSKPWAEFTAKLYDVNSGQAVWYATATTGGGGGASWTTVVHSMADKTLEKLAEDRVIE